MGPATRGIGILHIMTTTAPATSSPHLLSAFDLRGLALRNRVIMAPLTRARAGRDRLPNDLMTEYYVQRASAGLIIAEATVISEQGFGWVDSPGIYNDAQEAGWRKLVAHPRHADFPAALALRSGVAQCVSWRSSGGLRLRPQTPRGYGAYPGGQASLRDTPRAGDG